MKTAEQIRAHYAAARLRCARNKPALRAIETAERRALEALPQVAPLALSSPVRRAQQVSLFGGRVALGNPVDARPSARVLQLVTA